MGMDHADQARLAASRSITVMAYAPGEGAAAIKSLSESRTHLSLGTAAFNVVAVEVGSICARGAQVAPAESGEKTTCCVP